MTKFVQVSELVGQIEAREVRPRDGLERLRVIDASDSRRSAAVDALAFALCAVGFGVILALPWRDIGLAALVSLLSFALTRAAADSEGLAAAIELVAAAGASALAALLCLAFPGSNALGIAICATIWFVPGFGLTLGANELMAGNTLSGLIGFTNAVVSSVKLLAGALIGYAIVSSRFVVPRPDAGDGVGHAWTWLFAPVLVLGLSLLFRVRTRDLAWPIVGALIVWAGVEMGSGLGFWQGTFLGAFILRFSATAFRRWTRLPPEVVLLPAVMLIVPGVATLRAFYMAQTEGLVEGLRSGYNVIVLVAAILGGTLFGAVVWSLRRPRFTPIVSTLSRALWTTPHDKDAD